MKHYLILVAIVLVFCGVSMAQTTDFTYQGSLKNGAVPATGNHDFEFLLFDAVSGGTQIGTTIPQNSVPVADGTFTVKLNFGMNFPGANRFLEIHVRQTGGGGFTPLTPRQAVTSSPYAVQTIRAASAAVADTVQAGNITGVLHPSQGGTGIGPAFPVANTFLRSNGAGWTASGIFPTDIPGGNTNYIQNATTQQTTSNFNVSGTGTANIFNATTQFNIGGNRVLSGDALGRNIFAGFSAGSNTSGIDNSFFGTNAGSSNMSGVGNSFYGLNAGANNTTGSSNTIIGNSADVSANNLTFATAIGAGAIVNTSNTVVLGRSTDTVQIPGALNLPGTLTASGSNLTNINAANISTGTLAVARLGNAVILNGTTPQATSNFNVSGSGTANIFNAATQYNIGGNRVLSNGGTNNLFAGINAGALNTGGSNSFFGYTAGQVNTTGGGNSFFGAGAGQANMTGSSNSFFGVGAGGNTTGNSNSFFGLGAGGANTTGINNAFVGTSAGVGNTTGSNNTIIGTFADVATGNLSNATAIGGGALVSRSNSLVLGNGVNVGIGASAPLYALHVVGENVRVENNNFPRFSINFTGGAVDAKRWQNYGSLNALNFTALNDAEDAETVWLRVNRGTGTAISSVVFPEGNVVINNLGAAGSTSLCRNALNQISTCTPGNLFEQQTQVTKQQLQIEAQVKQNQALQRQIDEQNQLIKVQKEKLENAEMQMNQQKTELEAVKALVCSQNPTAELCSSELRLQP
jgi:hypothetical protein